MATHGEEFDNGLTGELVDDIERTGAVRGPRVVAKVYIVVVGKQLTDAVEDRQTAITRVEYSNWSWIL